MAILNRCDIAVIVCDYNGLNDFDNNLIKKLNELNIPYFVVVNKSDEKEIKLEDSYIYTSANKIEKFFEEETNRTIGAPQSQILIRRSLNSLSQNIKYNILRTRLENHLDQRDYIQSKVARLVSYEWGELSAFLANFECDKKTLADNLNNDDAQIIIDFMLEQIYLDKSLYTVASMDQATDLLMNGIKQQVLTVFQ